MAQQAVKKQAESAPIVRRRTRTKPGIVPDYSRWNLSFTDPEAFMAYMWGYPAREGVMLFLYRVSPRIDLSLIGLKESNIQKGGYDDLSLYTPEAVAEKFGSGRYQVRVTDSNRADGQRQIVKSVQYKIETDKAPVYDMRTLLLNHADNMDEVNRLMATGVLVRDASGAPRLRTAADAAGPVVAAAPAPASAAAGFGADIFGQIVLAAINKGAQSPHDVVKDTIEVARLIAPPAVPLPSLDQIADAVVSRMGGPRNGSAGGDPFSNWERVQAFVDRVRGPVETAGSAASAVSVAAGAESWAPHLGGIIAQARAFIPELIGALREFRENGNGNGDGHAQNGQPQQGENPMRAVTIEDVLRLGFQKMQEGVSGFDFASFVCFHMPGGLQVYKQLEPSGAQGVIALAAMNPQARPLVNDTAIRPQLETFLTDFFTFDPAPSAAESVAS